MRATIKPFLLDPQDPMYRKAKRSQIKQEKPDGRIKAFCRPYLEKLKLDVKQEKPNSRTKKRIKETKRAGARYIKNSSRIRTTKKKAPVSTTGSNSRPKNLQRVSGRLKKP